jgi:hypothetical protein
MRIFSSTSAGSHFSHSRCPWYIAKHVEETRRNSPKSPRHRGMPQLPPRQLDLSVLQIEFAPLVPLIMCSQTCRQIKCLSCNSLEHNLLVTTNTCVHSILLPLQIKCLSCSSISGNIGSSPNH